MVVRPKLLSVLMSVPMSDSAELPLSHEELASARKAMSVRAREAIRSGTVWLTVAQLAQIAGVQPANCLLWQGEGRIFALDDQGEPVFPRYALDADGQPLPAVATAISLLREFYGPLGIAAWFESKSGFLNGSRPRDLLAGDAERVAACARDTFESIKYAG